MTAATARRERRVRLPGLAIATLVLLVLAVGSLAPAVGTALQQRRQIAETRASIAAQQAEARSLDARIAQWSDPAYLRAEAGSRLLFVVPGETTYRVVGSAAPVAAKSAEPASDRGWAQRVLASVLIAGGK